MRIPCFNTGLCNSTALLLKLESVDSRGFPVLVPDAFVTLLNTEPLLLWLVGTVSSLWRS